MISLDIKKGDLLLGGRFKNVKTIVKKIDIDKLGQPTVNGKKLLAFRIAKLMEKNAKTLTRMGRAHVADKNFALPGKRYPIHDMVHARNALARVAQHGTPKEQVAVRSRVHNKFPSLEKNASTVSRRIKEALNLGKKKIR